MRPLILCTTVTLIMSFLSITTHAQTLPDLTLLDGSCSEHGLNANDNAWDVTIFDNERVTCTETFDCRDRHFSADNNNSVLCIVNAVAEPHNWTWSADLSRFGYQVADENGIVTDSYLAEQDGRNHVKNPFIDRRIFRRHPGGGPTSTSDGWYFSPEGTYIVDNSNHSRESWYFTKTIYSAESGELICEMSLSGSYTTAYDMSSTCSTSLPTRNATSWNPSCYYWGELWTAGCVPLAIELNGYQSTTPQIEPIILSAVMMVTLGGLTAILKNNNPLR